MVSFRWVRFLITFGAAAGYQISYAAYVSDYSRYLRKDVPARGVERPATEPQFSDRYDTVNGLTSGPASALNSEMLPTDRSGVGSDLPCAL